jgi:DNA-binding NarL/FixJ family response regulator
MIARDATVTCVVADDHPSVLRFLSTYLPRNGITVTGSTRDGEEALRKIERTEPNVAILDARMPRLNGVEVTRVLAERRAKTRVILYTGYADQALVVEALDAGVSGVIDKEAPVEDLVRAIQIVADGGTYLDPSSSVVLVGRGAASRAHALSPRERDVLRLLADGHSNEAIGATLTISPQTVRTHIQKAMAKLGATTRIQAVAIALRESLIG